MRGNAFFSWRPLGQDGLVLAHGSVEAEEAAAQPGGVVADTFILWFTIFFS